MKLNLKTHLVLPLLSTTILAGLAPNVFAQNNDDEVIVEATRRASNIQDVPLAVTAVSPQLLKVGGVDDITDLANVVPGFNIQSSQTESQGTSMRIRGVGTTGNNIGLESAVAVFIDGVYQSRPGVALGELVDLDGVEVLRGPQGTLFGRNTTAGALVIRTKKPELDEMRGFADFTYGNFNHMNIQAGVNLPASDTLGFRVTGAYRKRDGFLTSTVVPGDESHNRDRFMIRGQALWEPTDQTSVRIIADYQETDENCCASVTLTTSPNLSQASLDAFYPAVGFEDGLEARRFNSPAYVNSVEQKGVSAELNHSFGEIDMTLIGSWRDFLGNSRQDDFQGGNVYSVAGVTFPPGTPATFDAIETLTAEIRFNGTAMDDKLDWLVGGFYADESIQEIFSLGLGSDFSSLVSEANFGSPAVLGLFSAAGSVVAINPNTGMAVPTGNPFVPISSDGSFSTNDFRQDAQSFSVFTHNIFSVTDTVDLTVGARYVDDSKDGSYDQLAASNPACLAGLNYAGALGADPAGTVAVLTGALGPAAPAIIPTLTNAAAVGPAVFINCFPFAAPALGVSFLPAEFDDNFSDEELIYTGKLAWKMSPDHLLYGGFTHGYKAGGFNLDSTAAAGGGDPRFLSEEIDSWEVGLKSTLADGRVRANITGFYSTMDDFQVLEFTGTQFQTFNVDDVSSKGVELEVFARLSDTVTANGGVTYAKARYGAECDRGGTISEAVGLCDSPLTNAPEVSGSWGVTYDGDLGDTGWGLLANVNMAHQSKRRTSTRPMSAAGVLNPLDYQKGSAKVNATVGFTMPNGITFNTPLQGASRSAFIQDPRTYGATLRTEF